LLTVKGVIKKRDTDLVFQTTSFTPPSKFGVLDFVRTARRSSRKYLDKRGLPTSEVNWAAIKGAQPRGQPPTPAVSKMPRHP
jgi:hypothetical protein